MPENTPRYHALDKLPASMMLLSVIKHALMGAIAFAGALACEGAQMFAPGAPRAPVHLGITLFYSAATWMWMLALIGGSLRYLDDYSATWRYLTDAAYWVYLVHMLFTSSTAVLLHGQPWGAGVKFAVVWAVAAALSLLSYHVLVRNTAIGRALNGRVAPLAPLAPARGVAAGAGG